MSSLNITSLVRLNYKIMSLLYFYAYIRAQVLCCCIRKYEDVSKSFCPLIPRRLLRDEWKMYTIILTFVVVVCIIFFYYIDFCVKLHITLNDRFRKKILEWVNIVTICILLHENMICWYEWKCYNYDYHSKWLLFLLHM